jgi:hypothetical protein
MRRLIAAAAATGLLASRLPAQVRVMRFGGGGSGAAAILEESPAAFGVGGWQVGQWARYSISENVGGPMPLAQFRTVSVVGREGERYWVETATEFSGMTSGQGPVRKTLAPFGSLREQPGRETHVLSPDSSVRRETLVRTGNERAGPAFPRGWSRVGEERVSVAAGAFLAVQWRKGDAELWTSGEAGPLGVVKYQAPNVVIELAARGAGGARTRIPFAEGH